MTAAKTIRRILRTVEEHGDILPVWARAGFADREVIIFDRHLDYKFTPPGRIAKAKAWFADQDGMPPIRDIPFRDDDTYGWGIDDFIWVAAELGLIKSLIWVIPVEAGCTPSAYGRVLLQQMERIPFIGMEVLQSLTVHDAFAEVRPPNLRIRVTSIRHLAMVPTETDVHVEFDLDYFVSNTGRISHTVEEVLANTPMIAANNADITLCFSETSGFLPARFRSLADDIAHRLDCGIEAIPAHRRRFPASEDLLKGVPINVELRDRVFGIEIPLMGACGNSWAAEQYLALDDIESASESIKRARLEGDRAAIPCYKLGMSLMKRGDYIRANAFLESACETMTDTIAVHAFKLMLICHHRLGLESLPAEKMKFAVDALPHNLGILELIASRWKCAESEAKLGILIIANIEMRERLGLPAPAAAPARIP